MESQRYIVIIKRNKYFSELYHFVFTAEKGCQIGSKSIFFENILSIINLALKVPDIYATKYWYFALGLYSEYHKNLDNSVYAYSRFKDFAESVKDYE